MIIFYDISFAVSWIQELFSFFQQLGAFGPFLFATLDAIFFMPFGIDFLMIAMFSSSQSKWLWVIYIIMASLGSLLGNFLVDLVMRNIGEEGLKKFVKPKKIEKIKAKMKKNAGWTIFIATLLPPPFPFTPIIWTASALKSGRKKMFLSLFFGRIVRFTIEALLTFYFGQKILGIANSKIFSYSVYALAAISLIGSIYYAYHWTANWRGIQSTDTQSAT